MDVETIENEIRSLIHSISDDEKNSNEDIQSEIERISEIIN